MDPALVAYVEALEAALGRARAREHVLTPRDFALARAWHAAGLPVGWVLESLAEALERGEAVNSLAYLKRRIETRAARRAPHPS